MSEDVTTAPVEEKTEAPASKPADTSDDLAKLKAALDKERELRRDADKRAKELAPFKARVEEIDEASKSEQQKLVERAQAAENRAVELAKTTNARLISAEARFLAAEAQFRDAGDAVRFLDLDEIAVSEDGSVDNAAISKQLADLAKNKPYLLIETKPPVPTPGAAGIGVSGSASDASVTPGMGRLRQAYTTK